jgi:hypothetical protein
MFDAGQNVIVISEKGITYDATILAVAKDDSGKAAYKVALAGAGPDQLGQWHKAADVFLQTKSKETEEQAWDTFTKM